MIGFVILAVGLVNLVLSLYILMQLKSVDMRTGFIVNFLTKEKKEWEKKNGKK